MIYCKAAFGFTMYIFCFLSVLLLFRGLCRWESFRSRLVLCFILYETVQSVCLLGLQSGIAVIEITLQGKLTEIHSYVRWQLGRPVRQCLT